MKGIELSDSSTTSNNKLETSQDSISMFSYIKDSEDLSSQITKVTEQNKRLMEKIGSLEKQEIREEISPEIAQKLQQLHEDYEQAQRRNADLLQIKYEAKALVLSLKSSIIEEVQKGLRIEEELEKRKKTKIAMNTFTRQQKSSEGIQLCQTCEKCTPNIVSSECCHMGNICFECYLDLEIKKERYRLCHICGIKINKVFVVSFIN